MILFSWGLKKPTIDISNLKRNELMKLRMEISKKLNEVPSNSLGMLSCQETKKKRRRIKTIKPTYSHPILGKISFVFEVMNKDWIDLKKQQRDRLLSNGPFDEDRKKFVSRCYLVPQPDEGVLVTVARDLSIIPHGQIPNRSIDDVRKCYAPISVTIPECGALAEQRPLVQTLFLPNHELEKALKGKIFDFLMLNIPTKKDEHRQRFFVDLGVTGGRAHLSRSGLGVSKPDFLSKTLVGNDSAPFTKWIFELMTRSIRKLCPFVWKGMPEERLEAYARKISPDNIIEAMRICAVWFGPDTEKMLGNICNLHVDEKNDVFLREVVVFSTVVYDNDTKESGTRISVILYTRQSINNYLIRETSTVGPAVQKILLVYNELVCKEKFRIDCGMLAGYIKKLEPTGTFNNKNYYDFPCHLNPMIYMSPVISTMTLMITKHKLNFVETVSMIRAFGALANTTHYISVVLLMMAQEDKLTNRGVELGRDILYYTKKLYLEKTSKAKTAGLRFPRYNEILLPDQEEWKESVRKMVFYALIAFEVDQHAMSKEDKRLIYKKTLEGWKDSIRYAGILITNHLLGIASILGVVPLWFIDLFHVSKLSKGLEYFRKHYNLQTSSENVNQFFKSIVSAFQQRGIFMTVRIAENVVCKVYRIIIAGEEKIIFCDHHIEGTPFIYNIEDNKLIIEFLNGEKTIVTGSFIYQWYYKGQWTTLHNIVRTQSMTMNLKNLETFQINDWSLNLNMDHHHEIGNIINIESMLNIYSI